MNYSPNTPAETREMLDLIGVKTIEELFSPIPKALRAKPLDLPAGKSEFEVMDYLKNLSQKNISGLPCFIGAGIYDHIIPSAVDALSGRAEFYTAYTPYQPECSQGTLQALFEYQTAICTLTGMDISNASLYDGATAVAEAALMAVRATERSTIIIDGSVNPNYRAVLKTYLMNRDIQLIEIEPLKDALDRQKLAALINEQTAAVIVQNPNFFGRLDDYSDIAGKAHTAGALLIASVYPISLGLVKTPGEMGADIAVGDGQSLGNYMSFGGPSLGLIATLKKYVRQLPGRIIGETIDRLGKRGYVLTLQAREQHIKRQKATSNICSNQSLCALRASIFLSSIGKTGFQELASRNYSKSEFAKTELLKIKGVKIWNSGPTFNEFVIELPKKASETARVLLQAGFAPGFPLSYYYPALQNHLLIAVTEKRTKEEILGLKSALEAALWK